MKKISTSAYIPTEIEVKEISSTVAQVIAHPFQEGFGITLAHPLRRLLLNSTVGYAPIAIKIDGVTHEFDSIRGMLEDVSLFIINLKNTRFKVLSNNNQITVDYSFLGPKEITGKDLNSDEIEIVTPNKYLATINEDAELKFSIILQKGIGYVPSEDIRDDIEGNYIALDAFFTPVKKAVYEIENVLVEDNPNFEKVVFTIESDGQISPIDAFKNSLEAMYNQMSVFQEVLNVENSSKEESASATMELKKLMLGIEELNLSARSFNCLEKAKIKHIGELALMSDSELKNIKNLGKKSLDEIKDKMDEIGFPVGTEIEKDLKNSLLEKLEEVKG